MWGREDGCGYRCRCVSSRGRYWVSSSITLHIHLSVCLSIYLSILRQRLSLNLEPTNSANLANQQAPGTLSPCLPPPEIIDKPYLASCMHAGDAASGCHACTTSSLPPEPWVLQALQYLSTLYDLSEEKSGVANTGHGGVALSWEWVEGIFIYSLLL